MQETFSNLVAKHLLEVFFGGNWTVSNLKEQLSDVTWQQATTEAYSLNSIAKLTYHIGYFISAVLTVLQGKPLEAHDKYSFDVPPISSQQDWEQLANRVLTEAGQLASLIEQLPDSKLMEDFVDKKYGSYYRNLHGLVEHTHYHLGQIAQIKKILSEKK